MSEFKYYSWSVSMDDGTRYSYDFEMHRDDPWVSVLRKFGKFLEAEGFTGAKDKIEEICYNIEEELDNRIAGVKAMQEYHGKEFDSPSG